LSVDYAFSQSALDRVSAPTRDHMVAFASAISHAEGVLREYRKSASVGLGEPGETLPEEIQNLARQVFAMTWAKTAFYMRGVVTSANDGNLLVAAQSLRAMIEMSSMLRMTTHQLQPLIDKAVNAGEFTNEEGREILRQLSLLLHGGKFDWATYFLKGAKAVLDGRDRPVGNGESASKEMLRVSKCIKSWAKETPVAGFVYDYLCDLVHPNKGSNLLMIEEGENEMAFGVEGASKIGWLIFDQIFGPASKFGMEGAAKYALAFAAIGQPDA
jgi:hypothetical protein